MQYRYLATSVEGFVQQIACCYLRHGYWWYVTGHIPKRKSPECVDAKLLERYDVMQSEWRRARRKQLGQANIQYLRHGRFFVLLATAGQHRFFQDEKSVIRDFRRNPLRFQGYAISYRRGGRLRSGERDPRWHAHVEIDRRSYLDLKAWFEEQATRRSIERLTDDFHQLPFEPYAPVRRQFLNVLRAVNRRRKTAGMTQIPSDSLRLRRTIVRPFDDATPLKRRRSAFPPSAKDQAG